LSAFELYVSPSNLFGGGQTPFEAAEFAVVGVPFDLTSTYRRGARLAPPAIREASLNIETYSFRSKTDFSDLKVHDLGNLHTSNNVKKTLANLEETVKDLIGADKVPVLLGGEHTITLGAARALGREKLAVISFDAHLDLRHTYSGTAVNHTTFMRRLNEQVKPEVIVEVGTRAVCREELQYAEAAGIQYYATNLREKHDIEAVIREVVRLIEPCRSVYLTVDMDVLDPAFAPAVQNPEPNGLSSQSLLAVVSQLCDKRVAILDLVEVAPPYDHGVTAIQAARLLFEALCCISKARES
jgi:agmatinase